MSKGNKVLSIIIPVYNVQDYVEKCLDSLINQTLKNIEVIIIDDGSTDKTGEIVDTYKQKYPDLFKVFHKKNEGVSIARNVGLENVTGEYIGFLDPDDWVSYDMYEKLYQVAIKNNCDIVACDTLAIYPDKKVLIESHINETSTIEDLMLNAYAVLWNKIYKREIIGEVKFKQVIGMNFCEDVRFLYMVYPQIKKIGVIHEALHNYLQRSGSLTYVYNEKLYQLIDSLDDIVSYYKEQNLYEKYYDELEYSYVRYLFATFIKRLAKTKNKVEFDRGVNFVLDKVNTNFPNYKKNKYIKKLNGKSLYLKYFNKFFAKLVFNYEKNKLN